MFKIIIFFTIILDIIHLLHHNYSCHPQSCYWNLREGSRCLWILPFYDGTVKQHYFKLHIKIRSNLENYRIIEETDRSMRVLNRFFRMWDFLYLKLGIHDFKAKSGRDSGLKVYTWNIKHTCSHTDYGIAQKFDLGR